MSRARSLKPGFFRNPELSTLSPLTRLFFQGLWCEADRRGIVEDRPKKLKADILPYDRADPEAMLKNLESLGFIQRYEVDGVRCILIVKFSAHQNPHRDEKASTLPAPCQHSVDTVQDQGKTGTDRALTLNPITDSLNPEPRTPQPPKGERVRPIKSDDLSGFAEFYEIFPRHVGRDAAEKAWVKLNPDERAAAIAAIRDQVTWPTFTHVPPEKIPHPTTWLNQGRWKDERDKPTNVQPIRPPTRQLPPMLERGKVTVESVYGDWYDQGGN